MSNPVYDRLRFALYVRFIDPLFASLHQKIADLCHQLGIFLVLDIASATGAQSKLLSEAGIATVGVDISDRMVRYSRRRDLVGARFNQGSALDLPFPADSFRCILLIMALHGHPPKEQAVILEEASRVLCDDGRLIIAEYTSPRLISSPIWWLISIVERLFGRDHYGLFLSFVEGGGMGQLEVWCTKRDHSLLQTRPAAIISQHLLFLS